MGPTLNTLLIALFWTCTSLLVYAYIGYPLLIWLLARLAGRPPEPPDDRDAELPTVSLVLSAYNEEAVIEDRLRDALAVAYPPEKFEIVVGTDGCTDHTADLVRALREPRIRLLDFARNRGKASVLNEAVAEAHGELLLLSDANTYIDPTAVRRLVRWFRDPDIGVAVGRLVLTDSATGRNADGLYWKYETFLKRNEDRLGAILGANGAIYAMRRDLYVPIPPGTIIDDFVIPLLARLKTGRTIVYDCDAVAYEETAPNVGAEFHRRARIGAGGFQSIGLLWKLLNPRHGWTTFAFLSHKILRWLCPFFLIGILTSSLLLWQQPIYRAGILVQAVFYALSGLMALLPGQSRLLRPLRLTTMFAAMNMALLVGFWRWASGRQKGTWRRTTRLGEAQGSRRA